MEIRVPKIVRPLNLSDYAPEMAGAVIQVWVNPPRQAVESLEEMAVTSTAIVQRMQRLSQDQQADVQELAKDLEPIGHGLMAWFAENWSQAQDEGTHWSPEEVEKLINEVRDTDPLLWPWLMARTRAMIREYRDGSKKV